MITLLGCNRDVNASETSILIYNHQIYVGMEGTSQVKYYDFPKVGRVSRKIINNIIPNTDAYSDDEILTNELAVGTEIYQLDENKLFAKINDRIYKVFELQVN
jgi:ribosomal protein L15